VVAVWGWTRLLQCIIPILIGRSYFKWYNCCFSTATLDRERNWELIGILKRRLDYLCWKTNIKTVIQTGVGETSHSLRVKVNSLRTSQSFNFRLSVTFHMQINFSWNSFYSYKCNILWFSKPIFCWVSWNPHIISPIS
jgi:hypothetical protein